VLWRTEDRAASNSEGSCVRLKAVGREPSAWALFFGRNACGRRRDGAGCSDQPSPRPYSPLHLGALKAASELCVGESIGAQFQFAASWRCSLWL
jgi:hypothetical protein